MSDRLEQLQKMHEADPDDPFCTYGIALEHAKAGDGETALQWLDKTLEADADYAYAYFQKGRILGELGRTREAEAILDTGIARARAVGDSEAAHAAEEMTELKANLG